jgi:hypothetical protein
MLQQHATACRACSSTGRSQMLRQHATACRDSSRPPWWLTIRDYCVAHRQHAEELLDDVCVGLLHPAPVHDAVVVEIEERLAVGRSSGQRARVRDGTASPAHGTSSSEAAAPAAGGRQPSLCGSHLLRHGPSPARVPPQLMQRNCAAQPSLYATVSFSYMVHCLPLRRLLRCALLIPPTCWRWTSPLQSRPGRRTRQPRST